MASNAGPFLKLPAELQDIVVNSMTWHSILSLRAASRYFYELIPRTDLPRLHASCAAALLADEHVYRELCGIPLIQSPPKAAWCSDEVPERLQCGTSFVSALPCYTCLRWRPGAN